MGGASYGIHQGAALVCCEFIGFDKWSERRLEAFKLGRVPCSNREPIVVEFGQRKSKATVLRMLKSVSNQIWNRCVYATDMRFAFCVHMFRYPI